ncbi:hypothetical protein HDU98_010518 [Podochytrium sp. JEL0797]|nr:hypothetical protein HDU98_010518 [Podochytrium sp. JEL0797]
MILTESLILSKAKGFSRTGVSKDNLTDVSCLASMPFLEVVSLPVNRVSDLQVFSHLPNLQELYLRKNEISDPRQLVHLLRLPRLKHLWIAENPICEHIPNYRVSMVRLFPGLVKLDDKEVTERERRDAGKGVGEEQGGGEDTGQERQRVGVSPAVVVAGGAASRQAASGPALYQIQQQQQQQQQEQQQYHQMMEPDLVDPFFGNIRSIEQRYSQPAPTTRQSLQRQFPDPSSSEEDERIRGEIERLQKQRKRATVDPLGPYASRIVDERPIRPASVVSERIVGQGVLGAFGNRAGGGVKKVGAENRLSYESHILKEKQFQDHLGVGASVAQVSVAGGPVDNRKRHDTKHDGPGQLKGAAARVETKEWEGMDFRHVNSNWDHVNEHLEGAAVHVINDKSVNEDFRRRAFGPFGEGVQRVVGAGVSVDFVKNGVRSYRHQMVPDLRPVEEAHLEGSGMGVKVGTEYHNPRLGGEKAGEAHVVGSGVRVVNEDDFPVMEVGGVVAGETVKASKMGKGRPDWLKDDVRVNPNAVHATESKQSTNGLLLAVLGIVKDLDTGSLHILRHEVNKLLES